MQVFIPEHGLRHPILGVVGPLQFDVVEARLRSEYGIPCTLEPLPHVAGRWPVPESADAKPLNTAVSSANKTDTTAAS